MLETLTGLLGQMGDVLSTGPGLRVLVYGNTAVLLAINSIAGRSTARKKAEALRNKALASGGPLARLRTELEYWREVQRTRSELAKLAVERRLLHARRAESKGRRFQNAERSAMAQIHAARGIAEDLKRADKRREEAEEKQREQGIVVPKVVRRTRPPRSTSAGTKTRTPT
ncbi:hypothetical protein LG943_05665 [Streptomonospora sp. S1-112]|uniref:Uncharacterized protein n=1 Tax=Streptomonospora mangrovi TaxID=2883123 RepID=A0A9X3SDG9_9ACTN|nr:hypothetical protein [Streptomonospora mangrovi]MDA0563817.1 hypothetical protein [Streptomonospora mangrovi]